MTFLPPSMPEAVSQEELRTRLALLSPLDCAREVLGWRLASSDGLVSEIVEVEAYHGENDAGSHAWRGRTPRTELMFGSPGFSYVYINYGVHWLLNIVCRPAGEASAVLIRALRPLEGLDLARSRRPSAKRDEDLMAGPGRLSAAYALGPQHNGLDLLTPESPLQFLPPTRQKMGILCGPRVGLRPGRAHDLPWRLALEDSLPWVSRPQSGLAPGPADQA